MEGLQREGLLAELCEQVLGGGGGGFRLIAGERGCGKTHLGQELYRRLAATQEPPPFWPADLLDSDWQTLEEDRHTIRPRRLEIPAEARPTFVWVGINCQRSVDGTGFNSLGAASRQLQRLQRAVETTLRAGRPDRSRTLLLDLLEVVASFAALTQDPTATALSAALVARPAGDALREARASRTEKKDIRAEHGEGWEVDVAKPDLVLVNAYRDLLGALAERVSLPTVLFLDDFQHADPTLLALLEILPEAVPRNLTVICTMESAALKRPGQRSGEAQGVAGWFEAGRPPDFVLTELGRLDDAVLREIVLALAPRTPAETVAALAHRCEGNPYRLRLLLDAPRSQPQDGRIELDPREVMAFPNRIENLYREAWSYLPGAARRVVALAAMQGRAVASELLQATCAHIGIEDFDVQLEEARRQQWLIAKEEDTLVFPDEARYAVAVAEAGAPDTLGEAERLRAGTFASETAIALLQIPLLDWVGRRPPAALLERELPYLEAVASLGGAYSSEIPEGVARLTKLFADFLSERGEPSLAGEYLAAAGRRIRLDGGDRARLGLDLELSAAERWSDTADPEKALRLIREIERDCPPGLLEERALARRLAFVKGRSLARSGRPAQADSLLAEIADDPDDEDGLGYLSSAVSVTTSLDVGEVEAGAQEFLRGSATVLSREDDGVHWWRDREHCVELRRTIVRHELLRVNAGRVAMNGGRKATAEYFFNKADVLAATGMWMAAVEVYGDLLAGLEVVDPQSNDTLVAIGRRAALLSKLGRGEEALAEFDRAIVGYDEHVADAPRNRLICQVNRAHALSRLDRHDEALRTLDEAYDEITRLLGRDHPDALHNRMGVARALSRAGKETAAISMFRQVTGEFQAALGPDHPESRQFASMQAALERDPPLMSAAEIGSDDRPAVTKMLDERRAAGYRSNQADDWRLLFGTAGLWLRAKRTAFDRLMAAGSHLLSRRGEQGDST